jgi:hypothetical protein
MDDEVVQGVFAGTAKNIQVVGTELAYKKAEVDITPPVTYRKMEAWPCGIVGLEAGGGD